MEKQPQNHQELRLFFAPRPSGHRQLTAACSAASKGDCECSSCDCQAPSCDCQSQASECQWSTRNSQSQTGECQWSTCDSQPQAGECQRATCNRQPSTGDCQWSTCNSPPRSTECAARAGHWRARKNSHSKAAARSRLFYLVPKLPLGTRGRNAVSRRSGPRNCRDNGVPKSEFGNEGNAARQRNLPVLDCAHAAFNPEVYAAKLRLNLDVRRITHAKSTLDYWPHHRRSELLYSGVDSGRALHLLARFRFLHTDWHCTVRRPSHRPMRVPSWRGSRRIVDHSPKQAFEERMMLRRNSPNHALQQTAPPSLSLGSFGASHTHRDS